MNSFRPCPFEPQAGGNRAKRVHKKGGLNFISERKKITMEQMTRKIDAHDVADWFINRIDRRMGGVITAEVVQRLLYFAQAWYLANTGQQMFEEDFEAWGTGPIIPSVYDRFKFMDDAHLPDIENSREIKGSKLNMLEVIQRDYGCYMPFKLDELAKEAGGPWHVARRGLAPLEPSKATLPKAEMKAYYRAKLKHVAK